MEKIDSKAMQKKIHMLDEAMKHEKNAGQKFVEMNFEKAMLQFFLGNNAGGHRSLWEGQRLIQLMRSEDERK